MNLTIQQVAKNTKLSVPTLYTYASKQKLGKTVGNRKVFSQTDVQKLMMASRKSKPTKKTKPPAKKGIKHAVKRAVAYLSKPIEVSPTPKVPASPIVKRFAWTRLLFGRNRIP